jgi:hypothetical protein
VRSTYLLILSVLDVGFQYHLICAKYHIDNSTTMKHQTLMGPLGVITLLASVTLSAQAVTFTPPPNGSAPSGTGGASRGRMFVPPSTSTAPKQSTSGAARGLFTPVPGRSAPRQGTGGASRGNLFTPQPGNPMPQRATGGAARGTLFAPKPGSAAPPTASGGAARGDLFKPKSGGGAPQQAAGGASRVGSYGLDETNLVGAAGSSALTALLPQSFYGTTLLERPTILVYLPASTATEAVFSLKDEAGNTLHQATLPVSNFSGIMAIKLPADAPALAVGKNYQWFLALKVDGRLNPSTPYVDGWIQRIAASPELTTALQSPDALQQAQLLGRHGVWYDCVATLATLRATATGTDPLAKDWTELLDSVGLKEIAQVPLRTPTD